MVKLYYGNCNLMQSSEVFDYYFEKMNMQRREKVLRCKNDGDKMRSLMAGVLLRYGLKQEGLSYEALTFSLNSYGKPLIENGGDVFFSLSHSGDFVICGIADHPIGVDIEDANRRTMQKNENALTRIAQKAFSTSEFAFYEASPEKKECFLKLWTRKESYSKALGRGLGMDFSKIEVLSDKFEACVWSDWLREDYYVSVYLETDTKEVPVLIEWMPEKEGHS